MSVFAGKLAHLPETLALASAGPSGRVRAALAATRGKTVVAVGSGGSVVTAEYFARCRATLGLGRTLVSTPMDLVLNAHVGPEEVWLFSAGANNPDVEAAYSAACRDGEGIIRLMTANRDGAVARLVEAAPRGDLMVVPVADPKDGFLATHSMIAMVGALLLASDGLSENRGASNVLGRLQGGALAAIEAGSDVVESFRPGDTLVTLYDPQARGIATLIETSLWETGIAPVQAVDFRNFAHGRHVWAAKHPETMFILALTSSESRDVWSPIATALPRNVRRVCYDLGNAGRYRIAEGVLAGLGAVRRMGEISGIDPGRPGRGEFAPAIYDDRALAVLAGDLTCPVRHKRRAQLLHDPSGDTGVSLCAVGRERVRDLGEARFVGVALDYDGTIVSTQRRCDPPAESVQAELVRLVEEGVRVGIATGRGGSAGDMLRKVLPPRVHNAILMGYYNGGFLRPLDINIDIDRPAANAAVAEVGRWIAESDLLVEGTEVRVGPVQITIQHSKVRSVDDFMDQLAQCPAVFEGHARVLSSHHSFDIVPKGTSKLSVIAALQAGGDGMVLGIGDSGSPLGNDHELLSEPFGISVDSVCGDGAGCWSLYGDGLIGPDALVRILQAIRPGRGGAVLDTTSLGLDA